MVSYDTIHDMDDGEPGTVVGFHVYGHLDFFDVELFMADAEGILYDHDFDDNQSWDVTFTYMREVPWVSDDDEETESWSFSYSDEPKDGYRAVTKIETAYIASHMCAVHPMEPYASGISAGNIARDSSLMVSAEFDRGYGYVYLCKACADEFNRRYQEAYKQALIEIQFDDKQKELQHA